MDEHYEDPQRYDESRAVLSRGLNVQFRFVLRCHILRGGDGLADVFVSHSSTIGQHLWDHIIEGGDD